MKKSVLAFLLISANHFAFTQTKLQNPAEFLGYELGDRFTRHYRMVEYFNHVAEANPGTVRVQQYGETYEHRPLIYAIITSPDNFKNLEQIRQDNLRRAGMLEGTPSSKVAIVWLSYNVHGNEANSMEASIKTIYELVNPNNAKTKEWLKNTVVIMDPCINPDGRDRYANYYNQYGNIPANNDPQAREHREPGPADEPIIIYSTLTETGRGKPKPNPNRGLKSITSGCRMCTWISMSKATTHPTILPPLLNRFTK